MKIKDLYGKKGPVLSFEVFPPKKDSGVEAVFDTLARLAELQPDYISVTYGAGGGGAVNRTQEMAARIIHNHGTPSLAHLTCAASSREKIRQLADGLWGSGVRNVLAMRGDLPTGTEHTGPGEFRYASQLIGELKQRHDFCIGAACYPEGHIDCPSLEEDILHLKEKQEAGADFLITQLFFDNDLFFRFLDKARSAGVSLPVSAGVMPILGRSQIERMIFMCGASLPSAIIKLLHKYEHSPEDLKKAGIEYGVSQMEALVKGGAQGVHIYTMNRPEIASTAMSRLRGEIV